MSRQASDAPRRRANGAVSRAHKDRRVTDGAAFRLSDHDPDATPDIARSRAEARTADAVRRLAELQDNLAAQSQWALLAVFQAMDAAGKDGTIKHVFSGVNPAGVQVVNFKSPSAEELAHPFLWRVSRAVPAAGRIGVFNRSHYEEVLVTRVHPEILQNQHLPPQMIDHAFWHHRLEDIAAFETMLSRQGVVVLKFFLHISKEEQRERFLARLDKPDKVWKFSENDLTERRHWDQYMSAYQHAIAATATNDAPWYIIPGNHKWYARMLVAEILVDTLERLKLKPPKPKPEFEAALAAARAELGEEG